MRRLKSLLLLLAAIPLITAGVLAEDVDDSILVEQIQVAAKAYRRTLQDYAQLRASLAAQVPPEQILEHPQMLAFAEKSLNPVETEFRRLVTRYDQEFGTRRLHKTAQKRNFADLLEP